MKIPLYAALFSLLFSSCKFSGFYDEANRKFSDQYFKTAIAHIEMYNIRHGHYPAVLDSLEFIGDWNQFIFESVAYEKLDTGYRLDVVIGLQEVNPEEIKYPAEFWKGLGIKKSNVLK